MKNALKRSRSDWAGFHFECFRGVFSRCVGVVVLGAEGWIGGIRLERGRYGLSGIRRSVGGMGADGLGVRPNNLVRVGCRKVGTAGEGCGVCCSGCWCGCDAEVGMG